MPAGIVRVLQVSHSAAGQHAKRGGSGPATSWRAVSAAVAVRGPAGGGPTPAAAPGGGRHASYLTNEIPGPVPPGSGGCVSAPMSYHPPEQMNNIEIILCLVVGKRENINRFERENGLPE